MNNNLEFGITRITIQTETKIENWIKHHETR
jgi:hypothetical protein